MTWRTCKCFITQPPKEFLLSQQGLIREDKNWLLFDEYIVLKKI